MRSASSHPTLSQAHASEGPPVHSTQGAPADTRAPRPQPAAHLQGSTASRVLLATLVAGLHIAGLALLVHFGMQQPAPPEIAPIQVALIEAEQIAPPAAQPVTQPAPAPEPQPTPTPPPPEPPPPQVRRPEPPPPKPIPRKPAPKPTVSKPAPVTESPTALSAPADATPEPAPSPAPPAPPADAAPAAPAAVTVTEARFDAAYLNNPRPAYPMLSRRLREEGQVMLRVLVSPDGRPNRIELRTSSGSERLDRAAEEAVARWRFVPARQGEAAVEAWVLVPIVFKLKGN